MYVCIQHLWRNVWSGLYTDDVQFLVYDQCTYSPLNRHLNFYYWTPTISSMHQDLSICMYVCMNKCTNNISLHSNSSYIHTAIILIILILIVIITYDVLVTLTKTWPYRPAEAPARTSLSHAATHTISGGAESRNGLTDTFQRPVQPMRKGMYVCIYVHTYVCMYIYGWCTLQYLVHSISLQY